MLLLAISPEIATFTPQEATPASGRSALWGANVEGQQGGMDTSANCFLEAKYPCEFAWKDEYGGITLLQSEKANYFPTAT